MPMSSTHDTDDLEADYAQFCRVGHPIVAAFVSIAIWFVLIYVVGETRVRTGNQDALSALYAFVGRYNVEILFAAPAIIAAIRGRRYLKSILLGKLSLLRTISVGVCVGCACVLFSSIVSLSYFDWPEFDPHGFLKASGALPITAYLLGPFGEEMLYQVGLQTWLQRFGPALAVIGATAPFWGYHLYGGFVTLPVAIFQLFPAILAFALVRQTTKSFGATVVAHSTYNILGSCLYFVPR